MYRLMIHTYIGMLNFSTFLEIRHSGTAIDFYFVLGSRTPTRALQHCNFVKGGNAVGNTYATDTPKFIHFCYYALQSCPK